MKYNKKTWFQCFLLEPEGLLYLAVHVALHKQPWGLEPAEWLLVLLLSLQVLVPGVCVSQVIGQRKHSFVCLQLISQLGQERNCLLFCLDSLLYDQKEEAHRLVTSDLNNPRQVRIF